MLPNIRLLKRLLFLCFWVTLFFFGITEKVNATHIRAGEILVMPDSSKNDPRCVIFKLITFTDFSNTTADNQFATLFFGTGDKQESERWRRTVARAGDTYRSVYYFSYCFPAPGSYTVTYSEQNRQTNVVNIEDSQNQSFLLQTTITIDPFLGENHSPQMQVLPLDYGACGQIFVHNPGAYDADGDRLIFRLKTPQRNLPSGTVDLPRPGDVAGYRPLNDPSFGCPAVPNPPGGQATLTMDPNTGQLTWNAPCLEGDYNVAFVIEEYRNGRKIGEVLRDMQVRVKCTKNLRPTLVVPRDTCVIAGTTVRGVVRATDPDNDRMILEAYSKILPPATFNVNNNNSVGIFTWNTTCEDAELDTVQVTFKVTDIPRSSTDVPLTDIQPWRIRVVGPAPQNFIVNPVGRNMVLNWDSYTCKNATKIAIYRHEGPTNFVPSTCETGIPESAGFVRIGEVNVNDMTFTDNGGDTGLKRGVTYCYAIFAEFEGANQRVLPGIATLPVCIEQETSMPVITNVSVEQTDVTNGTILIKWTQPRAGLQSLVQPLQYRLLRAPGETPDVFTEVFRTNNLADTTFLDSNISTSANDATLKYIYKLEFYQNNGATAADLIEPSQTASSVQLKATARATNISLTWNYSVPWNNSQRPHYIYRKINDGYVLIDSVSATATTGEYIDSGTFQNIPLRPGQLYCYYVLTNGSYNNPKLPDPLLNKSQEFCVLLRDSIPPCPPVLSINPLDCDNFVQNPTSPPYQNILTWVPDQSPTCGQDIKYYTIYFRAQQEGEFDSIAFTNRDINTYIHSNLQSYAGCYVVTATDSSGNESAQSNVVCKENCTFFRLPNIFTPNNDGKNDTFRPDPRSLFIRSIRFTVYTRWGDKVYESTNDPAINWRGVNNAGKEVSDGTYYYQAEVEFQTLEPQNAKKVYKGWVEIVR